jgi:hypothetical protein
MPASDARLSVSILCNGAFVNDTPLDRAAPPSHFHEIFGMPNRIIDGSPTPAPLGHRNNQFHCYDDLGMTLNEHHYTHQIQAINFVFDKNRSDHPTKNRFRGMLSIGNAQIFPGALERQLRDTGLAFSARLQGIWLVSIRSSVSGQPITLAVATQQMHLSYKQRSKVRVITAVSLCLAHDPWVTSYDTKADSSSEP